LEHSADAGIRAAHLVEEAMSNALIRECPKCKAKFYKEEGCNKMRCSCGTNSCYICRAIVTDYTHYKGHEREGEPAKPCPLWDDTATRNYTEVSIDGLHDRIRTQLNG